MKTTLGAQLLQTIVREKQESELEALKAHHEADKEMLVSRIEADIEVCCVAR
jgi:hypothetical protein